MHQGPPIRAVAGGFITAALLTVGFPAVTHAEDAVAPRISPPSAVPAPKGEQGGVMSPYVSCSANNVEPRVKWVLTDLGTEESQTYRWRGALPGAHFPRVDVGRYRSRTTAWCRGTKSSRVHRVRVVEKTYKKTVSRREFKQVRRGMTRAQVREVVGFGGKDCSAYDGRRTCVYDMMAFWRWSFITFEDGGVVSKLWDVAHD
ncbi:hypothetical protein NOK12_17210 [Nocardioides sp. OK12]|uniref:hypothetical protein n=1 Tax=Nocardioides sp. OK12 TaxID=2758661 RepID=UPI0021C45FDF|nr:hypothetical protein [Nocardioides sp. OK12]GHJ59203.1 hypothetical protein NOK12_17210 [Nocardioides sp. OK12]